MLLPLAGVTQPPVTRNDAAHRYELDIDGRTAFLGFRRAGDRLELTHTEVPKELEGGGIGGRLVKAAVDDAAADGSTIVPSCPFARRWLERHPDAVDGVKIDWPGGAPGS